jgi:hypothetical protein
VSLVLLVVRGLGFFHRDWSDGQLAFEEAESFKSCPCNQNRVRHFQCKSLQRVGEFSIIARWQDEWLSMPKSGTGGVTFEGWMRANELVS